MYPCFSLIWAVLGSASVSLMTVLEELPNPMAYRGEIGSSTRGTKLSILQLHLGTLNPEVWSLGLPL